jgi:hypothetical protein
MDDFLRFSGAVKRAPAIDKWLRRQRDESRLLVISPKRRTRT